MGELASAHYAWPTRRLRMFHVDIEAGVHAANVRGATPIVADASLFLRALLAALTASPAGRPIRDATATITQVRSAQAALATKVSGEEANIRAAANTWVSPGILFRQLQARLPHATFTTDSGNGTTYGAESLRVRGARYMGPVNYSSMGFSVPAAIGAALALRGAAAAATEASESEKIVVAAVGDGAWRMTGPELASAVLPAALAPMHFCPPPPPPPELERDPNPCPRTNAAGTCHEPTSLHPAAWMRLVVG